MKRPIYFGQNARSSAKQGRVFFPHIRALNLIDGIVFTFADGDLARLCVYLAHELTALVLDGPLEMDLLPMFYFLEETP